MPKTEQKIPKPSKILKTEQNPSRTKRITHGQKTFKKIAISNSMFLCSLDDSANEVISIFAGVNSFFLAK